MSVKRAKNKKTLFPPTAWFVISMALFETNLKLTCLTRC